MFDYSLTCKTPFPFRVRGCIILSDCVWTYSNIQNAFSFAVNDCTVLNDCIWAYSNIRNAFFFEIKWQHNFFLLCLSILFSKSFSFTANGSVVFLVMVKHTRSHKTSFLLEWKASQFCSTVWAQGFKKQTECSHDQRSYFLRASSTGYSGNYWSWLGGQVDIQN